MILLYFRLKKKRFITILSIAFIIYFSTTALSQPSFPGNTLILGIRTISAPVAGYCEAFRDTLQEEIKNEGIEITSVKILNQHKGKEYSRYLGLLKDRFSPAHVDIECGPNSEFSGYLINPNTKKPFSENIKFIRFYNPTGIKLLIKKENAKKLANASSVMEYEREIRSLKIGVLEGTSTLKQLEKNKDIYNYVPIKSDENKNALERVLLALENNGDFDDGSKIDALASDDLILQSLLKGGIINESGTKGTKLYVGSREPYKKIGYVVFPSENYRSIN